MDHFLPGEKLPKLRSGRYPRILCVNSKDWYLHEIIVLAKARLCYGGTHALIVSDKEFKT